MIREQLKARSVEALKAGDKETRALLTGVISRFLEEEKGSNFKGFTEESERALVSSYVKAVSLPSGTRPRFLFSSPTCLSYWMRLRPGSW